MAPGPRPRTVGGTLWNACKWLVVHPSIVALFLLAGLLSSADRLVPQTGSVGITPATTIAGTLLLLLAAGVAHLFAARLLAGDQPSLLGSAGAVSRRLHSLVGISVVYVLVSLVGYVLLIVPGIYLSTRLSLAYPACVIDDQGTVGSLRASWQAAHGSMWTILAITVLALGAAVAVAVAAVVYAGLTDAIVAGDARAILLLSAIVVVVRSIFGPLVQMAYAQIYLANRPT